MICGDAENRVSFLIFVESRRMVQRIVIAPDKFKGSASSFDVCEAVAKGMLAADPTFQITRCPMADGGDGLLEVLAFYTGAQTRKTRVKDPLFRPVEATWLLSTDGKFAVIEMAKASGLSLLQPSQCNPEKTSTYGTGQLVKAAMREGANEIIIGLGGSATNDGGMGLAAALGYRFLNSKGKVVDPVGGNLGRPVTIDRSAVPDLHQVRFHIACDVKNKLCGEAGSARVYGPQKGADPAMVERLEEGMLHFAELVRRELGVAVLNLEGGGAAGGLGAGCVAFLGAQMVQGANLVAGFGQLEEKIKDCDLVITGEGRLDTQTGEGKVVAAVAAMAKKYAKPVVALCGERSLGKDRLHELGIDAAFSIVNRPLSLSEAVRDSRGLLELAANNLGAVIRLSGISKQ